MSDHEDKKPVLPVQPLRKMLPGDDDAAPKDARPARGRTKPARNAGSPRESLQGSRERETERETAVEGAGDLITDFTFDVLPELPDIPGFHLCWLSTTNQQDTVWNRRRLGYEPVKPEELGDEYRDFGLKTGDFAGVVGVREMVLFKISNERYAAIMNHFHHEQPRIDESRIKDGARQMQEDTAAKSGARVLITEGMNELGGRPESEPVWY